MAFGAMLVRFSGGRVSGIRRCDQTSMIAPPIARIPNVLCQIWKKFRTVCPMSGARIGTTMKTVMTSDMIRAMPRPTYRSRTTLTAIPRVPPAVHQPSAGFQGQATDIEIHANEVISLKKRLNRIYAKHTKKSEEEIKEALERDNFMTPEEAKDFGLIDKVVEKRD